jgi:hypothetical protein
MIYCWMNRSYHIRRSIVKVIACILCGCSCVSAVDVGVHTILGHVITVESGGNAVVVNRGSTVNVMTDSLCIIGAEYGQTRGFPGTVMDVFGDSVRVALHSPTDSIMVGDLCVLYAAVPAAVVDSDIGRTTMFDITFVDFYEEKPLCSLAELMLRPRQDIFDVIAQRFLHELYDQAEMGEYDEVEIRDGFYDGMTVSEAFANTDRYKLERFFRHVLEQYRFYAGKNWIFVNVFRTWVLAGTPVTASDSRH